MGGGPIGVCDIKQRLRFLSQKKNDYPKVLQWVFFSRAGIAHASGNLKTSSICNLNIRDMSEIFGVAN